MEQFHVISILGANARMLDPSTSLEQARRKLNLPDVDGGDQPLAQQQYYSLAELAKRQSLAEQTQQPIPTMEITAEEDEDDDALNERAIAALRFKMAEEFNAQA